MTGRSENGGILWNTSQFMAFQIGKNDDEPINHQILSYFQTQTVRICSGGDSAILLDIIHRDVAVGVRFLLFG